MNYSVGDAVVQLVVGKPRKVVVTERCMIKPGSHGFYGIMVQPGEALEDAQRRARDPYVVPTVWGYDEEIVRVVHA